MKKWHEYHFREQDDRWRPLDDIVSKVRLTLMSMDDLLKPVRCSNLYDLNRIMDAIDAIHDEKKSSLATSDDASNQSDKSDDLFLVRAKNHRGRLSEDHAPVTLHTTTTSLSVGLDENIATKTHHAQVIEGKRRRPAESRLVTCGWMPSVILRTDKSAADSSQT